MAVPKTFTAGERLFAADLNNNFSDLDGRTTALENAALTVETAGSNTVALNFSEDRLVTRVPTGNVVVTGSNYTAGKSITLRVANGATQRNLTFPAGWKFVSFKPANIAANKTGVLAVTSFGTAEADCVAAWAVQA